MINPKPEHRLTFLEKQFVAMGGHLEGIQEDIENLDTHVTQGFKQAHTFIQQELGEIKTAMATKEDLAAMETRLIDTMKMLFQQKSGE